MGRGFVISPNFEGSNLGEPKGFWVPQELSVRASDVWCLLAAALHLREGPRNHPKAGPWLELAWSAVSRVVSQEGAAGRQEQARSDKRQRRKQSQGGGKGETQLRLTFRQEDLFLKNQSKCQILPSSWDAQRGSFIANMTSPGYFHPIGEKSDLLAEDGGKVVYLFNRLCQEQSPLKLRGLEGLFLMVVVRGFTLELSAISSLSGNVCLKAWFASSDEPVPFVGGIIHKERKTCMY